MTSAVIDGLVEELSKLTVMQAAELSEALSKKWGVSAAPVAVAAAAAPVAQAAEAKSSFDVVLAEIGPNKLEVIKVVREITGLALKEAKDLVEGAPQSLKQGVDQSTANEIKTKVQAAGAKVEVK